MWSDEIATPVLVKTGIFAGTRSFPGIFENFQNMRESTSQEQSFDTINVVLSQRMKTQQLFEFLLFQKNERQHCLARNTFQSGLICLKMLIKLLRSGKFSLYGLEGRRFGLYFTEISA